MLSTKKRVLFSVLPAFLLVGVLTLLELSLRLFSPSLANPLLNTVTIDGVEWYQINRSYLGKYFPATAAMVPELKPSLIRKVKAPGTFRVFCLGESSMFGTPYELAATTPALIRKQLRHMFPGREIEVINLGASAINSNVMADLAPSLAALRPDVVLLYAGHNEFYGPDGIGASWLEQQFPFLTPLKYGARDVRIIRLLQRVLPTTKRDDERNLMREVSRGAQVSLGSAAAERIFHRFQENLRTIIRTYHTGGTSLIISDVSSNRMFPPFARPGGATFAEIPLLFQSGRLRELLQILPIQQRSDSANAFIDYWLGRTQLALGDSVQGRALLEQAKDEDLLKFRAPERINQIIRAVSASEGVPVVSADSLLSSSSPGGITDSSLFWEHLHLNVRGYDLLARLFLQAMIADGALPSGERSHVRTMLPFDPDSLSLCWLDLAYGELSVRNLTGRWPFTDFHARSALLDAAAEGEKRILLDVYNRTVGWTEACYAFAEYAEHAALWHEAMRTYGALIEEYPREYYPHYRLALLYKRLGDFPRASEEYARSISLNPDYVYAHLDLGLIENNLGNFSEAKRHLATALKLTEGQNPPLLQAQIYYGLAAVAANTGEVPVALEWLATSLRLAPSYGPALQLRSQLQSHR